MSLSKVGILVTKNAWNKMSNIIKLSNNNLGFLFSASSGGCNGFNFNLDLIDNNSYIDIIKLKPTIIENDQTKLYVDPLSEMYLLGTTIDYIKEDYSKGQFESKFVYEVDKNLLSTCGCGISFTPKN